MHCLKVSFFALTLFGAAQSYAAGIQIVNADGAGEGFNDTTAVSAIGGNTATTLGAQRLAVFNRAADILNATFDIAVTVNVNSSFDPLFCDTNSATLGSAGAADYEFINDGSEWTVYADALANQLQGSDVTPAATEINAQFNSGIGNPGCLQSSGWYLGFDDPAGNGNSLLSVVLHEIMHGMGFLSLLNPDGSTGATVNGNYVYDPYSKLLYDATQSARVTTLNQSQRAAATINNGNLVWDGAQTNAQLGGFSAGVNNSRMQMYAPTSYTPGSSVSHFDTAATPNEIMEPQYTEFLDDAGLAKYLLADIGWTLAATANSAPEMGTITAKTLNEDGTLNVTLSATDADGDSLTYSITSATTELDSLTYSITSATTELGASISGTTLTITPQANYNGSGSITVQVSDGALTDSTSFNVTVDAVNDAPVIGTITAKTLNEDATLGVTLSATDIDNGSLTYSITSATTELGASISGTTLTIAPQANFNGAGSITVQVSDGTLSDSTSFNVTVDAVNDAPVIGTITAKTLNEDATLGVTLSATDIDNGSLTYSITSATTELGASISGTTLTIAPQANFNGAGSITVQVSDGTLSDSTSFNVTVDAVNDAPVIGTITAKTLNEDATLGVTLSATDIDNGSLTYSITSATTELGASISGTTLTIAPQANFNGAGSITVQVSDGTLSDSTSFNVTVDAVNDAPVIGTITAKTLNEDATLDVALSATDIDSSSLTYSITFATTELGASISGTTLTIAPQTNYNGSGSIVIQVSDGILTDSTSFNVTVDAVNDAPVISTVTAKTLNEDTTLNVTLSATDADGDSLTYSITSATAELGASISGTTLTIAPQANYNGTGSITVQVSDGVLTDSTSFNVSVGVINDAPVLTAITAKTLNEDSTLNVTVSATDADGDSLTYSITSATAELGASISGTTLTIAPQANYSGAGSITVQVSDGALSDSTSFNVTVDPVNDAPVISAITAKTLNEDSTLNVTVSATDADGDSLTYSITSATAELGASISGATLTIAPQADYNGAGSITVQVSDGMLTDSTSVNVTVDPVNDAPVFTSTDNVNIANDDILTITLTATDIDTAAGSLTFNLVNFDSSKIDGSLNGSTLTLTPVADTSGVTMVEVAVSDGDITTSQSISVNVLSASNQAPVFNPPAALTLLQETSADITLSATDADNNSLTYSILSSSAGVSASISADQLSISADSGFSGTASISLSVSDGLLTDSAILAITVLPKFELQQNETILGNGDTLSAGLNSIGLALSGGDGQLTTSVFFNGSQQDNLLSYDSSTQRYSLAMPTSGAFAGTYTLTVSDGNGFSATYYIERPLRVITNVTPTLALSASQTVTVEGAPAATLLSLSSSSAEVTFSDANGTALNTISAADDAANFNAATAVLTFNAVSSSSQPVITASGSNLPDGELELALQPGRTVLISVSDQSTQAISTAIAAIADSRFELWGLPSSASADNNGNISLQLPQESLQLNISADGYLSAGLNLDSEQTAATATLTALQSPFSLNGIVQASGFDFSTELPQLTLLFDDDSQEVLSLNSISSTSVSYNWLGDLSIKTPLQLQIRHSNIDQIATTINTTFSSQTINVTLVASAPQPVTEVIVVSSGGPSGGGALWYLLLLYPIIATFRNRFTRAGTL
ncbi:tandem-95 repeat protein [Thalassolituus sp. C2-1]|uniref:tandem-95 repeat protein n=1 Tax=Venatorbacter sp. C2-1 TaxID=2597518 RepID=UPI001644054E|nr:tandem-95 repeat protein [Thalassolituus sp. C2-1]